MFSCWLIFSNWVIFSYWLLHEVAPSLQIMYNYYSICRITYLVTTNLETWDLKLVRVKLEVPQVGITKFCHRKIIKSLYDWCVKYINNKSTFVCIIFLVYLHYYKDQNCRTYAQFSLKGMPSEVICCIHILA